LTKKKKIVKKGIRAEFVGQAQEDEKAISAVIKGEVHAVNI